MKEPLKTFSGTVPWCQILIGAAGLLISVSLVDRPPDQTYLIYNSSIPISLYNTPPFLSIHCAIALSLTLFSFSDGTATADATTKWHNLPN